jgi:hypothetical protein
MKSHYLNTKLYKMGKWALYPADSMSWHGFESSKYFREEFGFGKGALTLHVFDGDQFFQHMFFPKTYFKKLKDYVYYLKENDFKGYENKVRTLLKLRQTEGSP